MTTFSGELPRFIGKLRLAEVPVSVAETLDAMRAVAAAGLGAPRANQCGACGRLPASMVRHRVR
jgi:hypothetical protein